MKNIGNCMSLMIAAMLAFALSAEPVGHGGMVTLVGDDAVHVFKTNGVFRLDGDCVIDVLVVGGGGGGATARTSGGGGGGGGVVYQQNVALTAGEYEIVVGAGGAGSYTNELGRAIDPGKGESSYAFKSSAFEIAAAGGGTGGKNGAGGEGASGGGGGAYTVNNPSTRRGGRATGGGFDGGASTNTSSTVGYSGGGGGAGHAGYNGVYPYDPVNGGRGGDGVSCDITGETKYYGGGGGGGFSTLYDGQSANKLRVPGGLGGGGNGSGNKSTTVVYAGGDGEPNTGGGGGGGSGGAKGDTSLMGGGGNGGSGVVIVRCHGSGAIWRNRIVEQDATGGIVRSKGAYRTHTFNEDGLFSLPEDAQVDILVVGGGGGGGAGRSSGGGGAGGQVLHLTNLVLAAGSYDVTVGLGGRGAITNAAGGIPQSEPVYHSKPGGSSCFLFASEVTDGDWAKALVSFFAEGGAPGCVGNMAPGPAGYNGGGASAKCITNAGRTAGGDATSAFGFAGGSSTNLGATVGYSGGGGGAGHAGYDGVHPYDAVNGGRGGDGVPCDITGAVKYYGGGGGGGFTSSSMSGSESFDRCVPGGLGGGGNGSGYLSSNIPYVGGDAEANTGGGGGGGGACPTGSSSKMGLGGHGASGVVILRYRGRPRGLVFTFR